MISPQKNSANIFTSIFSHAYDSILSLIYPQSCKICENGVEKRSDGSICETCWQDTYTFTGNETLCCKCGAFLKKSSSHFKTFCRRCDDDFYDLAKSIGSYEKALLISILSLKRIPFIPQRLENLLLQSFQSSQFLDADVIIPVPLSKKRLAQRGFNQPEILAKHLSKQTDVIIDNTSLRRKVHTEKSRRGMDRKARYDSVNSAFEVVSPRLIEGKNILLIDDVFTSGATVSACAKVLKKAGAKRIYVLTIARAI